MKQISILGFPQNVLILSFVSFLNDVGGQTIKYAIPLFLTNALGVKTSIVGIVEGIGEATPQLFQPLSGWISDKAKSRKPLIIGGQILRSSILLLFFASSWLIVLLARFLDRSGKGIQGAPRDALISQSAESGKQGKAFGLSRALDNAGAVVGLILAGILTLLIGKASLGLTIELFHSIVLFATIPMAIAVILLFLFVRDVSTKETKKREVKIEKLDTAFYQFLFIIFLFTLGNSSDAFLILKAQKAGLSISSIFFLLAAFSLIASLLNIPAGIVSDKFGRKKTILLGWLLYAGVYLGFAKFESAMPIIFLFLLYGVYYGLTEGVAKAYVADIVPLEKKGYAFGLYNMVTGLTLLPASFVAGFLWQTISPSAAFLFGGSLAIVASSGLFLLRRVKND
ncbi:MFS transporter [Candidatus Gottesmanbacteria bacterium]|nr:MFS transporter [Candidatus Gottesmanbacteria bacterium]